MSPSGPAALRNCLTPSWLAADAHTRREVEAALGAGLELSDVFDSFEEAPLASGSIAQIHRATLKGGEPVAVKVRHPKVVARIVTDFALMGLVADVTAKVPFLAWLNLKSSVSQFSGTMVAQTRLDVEGEHLDRFNWNFGAESWRDCAFPRVIRPTVTTPAATPGAAPAGDRRGELLESGRGEAHVQEPPPSERPHRGSGRRGRRDRRSAARVIEPGRAVLIESFEPGVLVSRYTTDQTLGTAALPPLDRDRSHFIVSRGEDMYLKMCAQPPPGHPSPLVATLASCLASCPASGPAPGPASYARHILRSFVPPLLAI